MIKSQRPMMLTSAINLSKLVQEEEVVSWGNIQLVEKYVSVLKEAVEKLSSENNILTSYHLQILEKVCKTYNSMRNMYSIIFKLLFIDQTT